MRACEASEGLAVQLWIASFGGKFYPPNWEISTAFRLAFLITLIYYTKYKGVFHFKIYGMAVAFDVR